MIVLKTNETISNGCVAPVFTSSLKSGLSADVLFGALVVACASLLAVISAWLGALVPESAVPLLAPAAMGALYFFKGLTCRLLIGGFSVVATTMIFGVLVGSEAAIVACAIMCATLLVIWALQHLGRQNEKVRRQALPSIVLPLIGIAAWSSALGVFASVVIGETSYLNWVGMALCSMAPAFFIQFASMANSWCEDRSDEYHEDCSSKRWTAELLALAVYSATASFLIERQFGLQPSVVVMGGMLDFMVIMYFYRRSFLNIGIALSVMFISGNIGYALDGFVQPLLFAAFIAWAYFTVGLIALIRQKELEAGHKLVSAEIEKERLRKSVSLASAKSEAYEAAIANLTHDLKSPIAAVQSLMEWSHELALNGKNATRQLDLAKSQIDILSRHINNVLDITQAELTDTSINYEEINLKELIEEVVRSYHLVAKEKSLVLEASISEASEMHVFHDRLRLSRILTNLVDNACKYTSKGSVKVKLETTELGEDVVGVRIDVVDTGRGIPADQHEAVFKKFHRVGDRYSSGLGIGLAIVSNLAETIGATLTLDSEPEVGSTFSLELLAPRYRPVNAEAYQEKVARSVEDLAKQILIVEDDPLHARLTGSVLSNYGNVKVVENGSCALHELSKRPYDLVVMDCRMPVLDGYSASEEIRASEIRRGHDGVAIVGLTSNTATLQQRRAISSGMDVVFTKPMTAEIAEAIMGMGE